MKVSLPIRDIFTSDKQPCFSTLWGQFVAFSGQSMPHLRIFVQETTRQKINLDLKMESEFQLWEIFKTDSVAKSKFLEVMKTGYMGQHYFIICI